LNIRYAFENLTNQPKDVELYLLIRPYQVNPYYQFLNLEGGAGKIGSIREEKEGIIVVDDKVVLPQKKYDFFAAGVFDDGNMVEWFAMVAFQRRNLQLDQNNLARGVIKYSIHLEPGEKTEFYVVVPFYGKVPDGITKQ
jgi:hypothetical protein